MNKAIHQDRPRCSEIKAAHIAKAFQPGRAHVVKAGAGGMEEREYGAFIVLVENCAELVVNAVHIVFALIVADVPAMRFAIGIQHSKIAIKAPVFLLRSEEHTSELQSRL